MHHGSPDDGSHLCKTGYAGPASFVSSSVRANLPYEELYIYIERERVDIATATTRFDISYSSSRIQQINDEKTLVASVV
jgi:hypothetical protein